MLGDIPTASAVCFPAKGENRQKRNLLIFVTRQFGKAEGSSPARTELPDDQCEFHCSRYPTIMDAGLVSVNRSIDAGHTVILSPSASTGMNRGRSENFFDFPRQSPHKSATGIPPLPGLLTSAHLGRAALTPDSSSRPIRAPEMSAQTA